MKSLNKYFERAREHLKSDHYIVARAFAGLGKVSHSMKNYENAMSYYNEAITIFKKHESKLEIADTQHRIGNLLVEKRDFEGASKYFEQSLEVKNNFIGPTSKTSLVTKLSIIVNDFKKTGSTDSLEAFKEILLEFDRESFPAAIIQHYIGLAYMVHKNKELADERFNYALRIMKLWKANLSSRNSILTLGDIGETGGRFSYEINDGWLFLTQ
jgi:tetratricopeptide (TPR) repeat protein